MTNINALFYHEFRSHRSLFLKEIEDLIKKVKPDTGRYLAEQAI